MQAPPNRQQFPAILEQPRPFFQARTEDYPLEVGPKVRRRIAPTVDDERRPARLRLLNVKDREPLLPNWGGN